MAKNTAEIYIYIYIFRRDFFFGEGKDRIFNKLALYKRNNHYLLTVKCTLAKHAWKEPSITT